MADGRFVHPFYFKILSSFSSCVAPLSFFFFLLGGCLCVCARQTIERRGSQFAQDRKRISQDQQHGWSKENVRKVSSLQSVVSCCGSYPLFFKLLFYPYPFTPLWFPSGHFFKTQFKIQLLRRRRRKTKWFWCVCVRQVVSCLLLSSKFDGLASTISPGATWLRIHPVYIAADYLPTVSFYFCVSAK
jgi:hypothetical protein